MPSASFRLPAPAYGTETLLVDRNAQSTSKTLDVFGRPTREVLPGDESSPFGTRTYVYSALGNASTQSVKLSQTQQAGLASTVDVVTFYDGFGQGYRTETASANGKTAVLQLTYDDVGNEIVRTVPYFVGDTVFVASTQYDTLRRIQKATSPSGAVTTSTYKGTRVDTIDPRGNLSFVVQDAYGNAVEKHEFVGGKEQITKYRYDVYSKLTQITDPLQFAALIATGPQGG